MPEFDHRNLEAYRCALRFSVEIDPLVGRLPADRKYLRDQVRRAAFSVLLNLAEGAGEWESREKTRFYRISRRSATECAAGLDFMRELKLAPTPAIDAVESLLERVVRLIVGLVRCLKPSELGRERA
jgi:four helix bundle protein